MMSKIKYCHQINETECGLCCVSMILSYFGSRVSMAYLRTKIDLGRDGMNMARMTELFAAEKIESATFESDKQPLPDTPVIAYAKKSSHYVVLHRKSDTHCYVYDPAVGKYSSKISDIIGDYPFFMMFEAEEDFVRKSVKEHYWKNILPPVKENKFTLLKLIVMSLCVYGLSTYMTNMIKNTVDDLSAGKDNSERYLYVSLAVSFFFVVFSLLRNRFFVNIELALDRYLNQSIFEKILRLPFSFFNSRGESDLLYRFSLLISIRSIISNSLVNIIIDGGTTVFLFIYISMINMKYAAVVALLAVFTFFYVIEVNKRLLAVNQKIISEQSSLFGVQMALVKTLEYVKTTGCEKSILKKFSEKLDSFLVHFRKSEKLTLTNSVVLEFLQLPVPFILLYVSIYIGILNENSIGEKITLYFIGSMIVGKCTTLFRNFTSFEMIKNILDRINDIYDSEPEELNAEAAQMNSVESIEFKNVTFRYSENSKEVLKDVNFTLKAGEKAAFVGETGSGKSTILKLTSGLYVPNEGQVLVNGEDLKKTNILSYRKLFSFMPQNHQLLEGNIRENLVLDKEYSEEQIEQCLRSAELVRDINQLPLGLNTKISGMSNNLSGGQKQRIVIARAMLNRGQILLSDEGTSSLDFLTERKVVDNLDELFDTQIVVAHRLSTVRNADQIYCMEDGKIIERGTHDELIAKKGFYYKLYISQEGETK